MISWVAKLSWMFQSKIPTDAEKLKKLSIAVQDTWLLLIGETNIVFRAFCNLQRTLTPKRSVSLPHLIDFAL